MKSFLIPFYSLTWFLQCCTPSVTSFSYSPHASASTSVSPWTTHRVSTKRTTNLAMTSVMSNLGETLQNIMGKDETDTTNGYTNGSSSNSSNNNSNNNKNPDIVPFVIERIERNNEKVFRDIAEMCIEVFFNEDTLLPDGTSNSSPFKGFQLAYLRNAQYSDLRSRMFMSPFKSDMFIAREVMRVSSDKAKRNKWEIIDDTDTSNIYNSNILSRNNEAGYHYVKGQVIGFCEVSARRIGLILPADEIQQYVDNKVKQENEKSNVNGENKEPLTNGDTGTDTSTSTTDTTNGGITTPLRPLLTNLAVKKLARRSGVGSELVNTCEDAITSEWDPPYSELVLQVEEDNPNAINFYKKRGYKVMYADPTTRRFDTTGLFLRKVRATKVCMRKSLNEKRARLGAADDVNKWNLNIAKSVKGLLQVFR